MKKVLVVVVLLAFAFSAAAAFAEQGACEKSKPECKVIPGSVFQAVSDDISSWKTTALRYEKESLRNNAPELAERRAVTGPK
jgi:hypothetical protein